jgi:metal-responsive CopG/Arc/MetJ family transcriptional regulator
MRSTALLTVSLPPRLARQVEKVAKEESRTKSELLREAIRLYIDTREARRAIARRQLFGLIDRVQGRTRGEGAAAVRKLVGEAVRAVRASGAARRRP